jgi:hypothetical protein
LRIARSNFIFNNIDFIQNNIIQNNIIQNNINILDYDSGFTDEMPELEETLPQGCWTSS